MLRYDAVLAVSGHHEPMRERKGAGRNDLGIAGRFILAAIVSALVWRHSQSGATDRWPARVRPPLFGASVFLGSRLEQRIDVAW